ncbi:helix-turn-helix protein [Nocardia tenerifensis]|uniref:Helix-turn-helix protein n=2 Tax=Nocardia tenerifensis TaxID=228006 RepID=A0A318KAP4_9NOCA|nr:helix-turn-helix domain-containing protein [Nocardia tenerifensis]PXX61772.1 helix-turn-helix protein [Nocardia tenerifensis]
MHLERVTKRHALKVGERIELSRRRQRLPRRVVANLVGRSEEWLRLIETGKLRLDSVQAILRLTEVLQLEDYRDLIESPVPDVPEPADPADRLIGYLEPVLLNHPAHNADIPVIDHCLEQWLHAEVLSCEEIWAESAQRYTLLSQRLPKPLIMCRSAYWQNERPETGHALARLYHLCREVLTCVGDHYLAAFAADRALSIAHHLDRPTWRAAGGWHWAAALLHLDQGKRCRAVALAAVEDIAAHADPDELVLYGALTLMAARGAAATPAESTRLLAAAQQLAYEVGPDRRVLGIGFGHCEIGLARMEIAYRCNDFDTVITVAPEIDALDKLPVGQRARYFTVLAAAYVGRREIVSAAFALTQAAEACAENLRYDHDAHMSLQQILRHDNRLLSPKMADLADLAGI